MTPGFTFMQITPIQLSLSALKIGQSGGVRAEGLHASNIYSDLYQDLEPKRFKRDSPPNLLLFEIGLAFETYLEQWLADRVAAADDPAVQISRPGEFTFTDVFEAHPVVVHYNPDLFIFNGQLRIGEIKATKMSSKIPGEWLLPENYESHIGDIIEEMTANKYAKYHTQLMFYLYMMKATAGRFYIYFVNGCYKPTMDPQFIAYDVDYSEDELQENYRQLMYHALHKGMI